MALRKFDRCSFYDGTTMGRGKALDVSMNEKDGIMVYIEQLPSHTLVSIPLGNIYRADPISEYEKESLLEIDKFINDVENGLIISEDGSGYYSDGEYTYEYVDFDVDTLEKKASWYPYVCWFGK